MRKVIVNIARTLLAVTFILSGFVKAVDPLGTQYKINDYLEAWGMGGVVTDWMTLGAAVLICGAEFIIGICLLFAIHRRLVSKITLALMTVMTAITLWLALTNPISDCGCFGDAIVLTNWQTFWKNVILLAATIIIWLWPKDMIRIISISTQWIVLNYSTLFILATAGWSLWNLPLFDFRPYHIGANIQEGMSIPEGAKQPQFETTFILEKNGEKKEFTTDNYPDSTWTFIDSKTVQTEEGYVPPIHDFSIMSEDGEDLTEEVLGREGYTFLLISPHLENADDSQFDIINQICEYSQQQGYPFYCLTASTPQAIGRWKDMTGAEYPFCSTDEITLKTVIRSNPGLVLLRKGTIIGKWSHNSLPTIDEEKFSQPIEKLGIGQMTEDSVPGKIALLLAWFVMPLLILTIADRLWAWTKWIRRRSILFKVNSDDDDKEHQTHLINKKKIIMRKKIVAGNWKMNMNLQDGIALAKELNESLTAEKPNCGVVICTPFIHLASIAQFLNQDIIGLGAENCADKEKGAFTGEVSAEMVKSTGAQYVILGHSERREYYKETPEILKEKVLLAQKNDLKVIFCIGESLEEREAGKQNEVVKAELEGSVFNLSEEDFRKIVIAYEPIWAIGTGKTATAEQAEEIHAYIRSIIAEKYGEAVADDTTILYGGSCKASNAPELFAKPDIDGGLIGGASLKAADFKGIIDAFK